jgi:hypothetical protein
MKTSNDMIAILTSITHFWISTLMWMCVLALAMCTVNAIHGVFIPFCQRGSVGFGLVFTLLAIVRTFKASLMAVVAAVVGFFWFLMYGTFVIIKRLVTNNA